MTLNILKLPEKIAKGNPYKYMKTCPQCGEKYFAFFDKCFIDVMGFCYWPCGDSRPEVETMAENILTIIGGMP